MTEAAARLYIFALWNDGCLWGIGIMLEAQEEIVPAHFLKQMSTM
jgi:hypothetical protein